MRKLVIAATLLLAATVTPAAARSCWWADGTIFCDPGCYVTERWWDGSRDWMRYACGLTPDEALLICIVGGFIGLLIIACVAAAKSSSTAPDAATIDADTAKTNELTQDIEATLRQADDHLAAIWKKYGGPHE